MATSKKIVMAIILLIFLFLFANSRAEELPFDVKQHLSTVTRYGVAKGGRNTSYFPAPDGCVPIHLNLVARHGTRSPTKKRIDELNKLENELEKLLQASAGNDSSLHKVPSWMKGWKSPWREKVNIDGELVPEGEKELYELGIRTRKLFPDLFSDDYHPDVYTIKATQVSRASASAVAFGMGLFNGSGSLGSDRHPAFSVITENRDNDTMLRFFKCCDRYELYKENQTSEVKNLKQPVLDDITKSLIERYGLNFTWELVSSLWFLCKQEASLFGITNQSCELFSDSEVKLLEWTDDIEEFKLKGYGNSLNYKMGVPLLEDVLDSMEKAITAKNEKQVPGSYEKARLRFAHAETVVPFTCLLGLFLEGEGEEHEFRQLQREQPLELPRQPPKTRIWKASAVSPFAGNNMLVLYSCPVNSSDKYFVRVLHNEEPVAMPGCDGSDFCSFNMFKDKVVTPHLKPDFNMLCTVNKEDKQPRKHVVHCEYHKHAQTPNLGFTCREEFTHFSC